jgi:hypothetical protein
MFEAGRRGGLAAAVTALAAVALAAAVAGRGCGSEDDTPDGAVRAFAAAARAGDRETMVELFGPETRAWLDGAAARASQLIGGSRRYDPVDLINTGALAAPPARIVVRQEEGGRARVEVTDEAGQRAMVDLVEVDGHWRVELTALFEPPP